MDGALPEVGTRPRVVLLHDERTVAEALLAVLREGLVDVVDVELASAASSAPDCDVLVVAAALWEAGQQLPGRSVLLLGDPARGSRTSRADDRVRGRLSPDTDAEEARAAVLAVLAGAVWSGSGEDTSRAAERQQDVGSLLTPREVEVLALISGGLTTQQISARLGVAEATVRTLRQRLFHKLDVHSAAEAVMRAAVLDLPAVLDLVTDGDRPRYDDPAMRGRHAGR